MDRLDLISTIRALGLKNVARVGLYRLGVRSGLHPVLVLKATAPTGPFFNPPSTGIAIGALPRNSWKDTGRYFSWCDITLNDPPDWHENPFNPGARADSSKHWSAIPDFDPAVGDIKTVWEASRFDWLLAMAQRAAAGSKSDLTRINNWLADWIRCNPPYSGANWKCGQEASIRVLHLVTALLILGQIDGPHKGLLMLVQLHLARIAPTMGYAIGQQNNHGTSEAAALFIGGSLLERSGTPIGARWRKTGVKWLENRAVNLVEPDGTFSQYSVNYHRMLLDTYSLAEVWRRRLNLPEFSTNLRQRLAQATHWLRSLTSPVSGDAPNLGANDGSRIVALTDTDYRDFRPSLQLAAALFLRARALEADGPWNQPLIWLGVALPQSGLSAPQSRTFDDGGLHVLHNRRASAFLKYPRFRFRPGQADALHLDLWVDGENIIRDGGTYSYNVSAADTDYFNGVKAHSTAQFDHHDQMPRLGRFLFGKWLRAEDVACVTQQGGMQTAAAAYRDHAGCRHARQVHLGEDRLVCHDRMNGAKDRAVLRWRLAPGNWTQVGNTVSNGRISLSVSAPNANLSTRLVTGCESRYYLQKTRLNVLEISAKTPATLITEIVF